MLLRILYRLPMRVCSGMFPSGPSVVEKDAERINKHENLVISVVILVPWGLSHYEKARKHL